MTVPRQIRLNLPDSEAVQAALGKLSSIRARLAANYGSMSATVTPLDPFRRQVARALREAGCYCEGIMADPETAVRLLVETERKRGGQLVLADAANRLQLFDDVLPASR